MNTTKETRNCPFCGSASHILSDICGRSYEVICEGCGARTAPCLYGKRKLPVGGKKLKTMEEAREMAIRLWDTRAGG